jgi:hypothetical protein
MNFSRPASAIETSATNRSLASFGSFEARMILIDLSMLASAGESRAAVRALLGLLQASNRVRRDDRLPWSMKRRSMSRQRQDPGAGSRRSRGR